MTSKEICVWDILQNDSANEFYKHSKESRGVLGQVSRLASKTAPKTASKTACKQRGKQTGRQASRQAGRQAGKQASRQAGKQALGRHSVGAMPWRDFFFYLNPSLMSHSHS